MLDDDDKSPRPVMVGWLSNWSRTANQFAPDAIHERLLQEVFDEPDPTRSHVITLHLFVEYWLDRLLDKLGLSTKSTFYTKIEMLDRRGVFDPELADNLRGINRLRNIYAHELDLPAANARVQTLLGELKLDPYFYSTDSDPLRRICVQVMFLLEATFHNDCKPPTLPAFPADEPRQELLKTGKLHWQQCEILSQRRSGYMEYYDLRCPYCRKGTICRERDATPGFKESSMSACEECGLSGDGSRFDITTLRSGAV